MSINHHASKLLPPLGCPLALLYSSILSLPIILRWRGDSYVWKQTAATEAVKTPGAASVGAGSGEKTAGPALMAVDRLAVTKRAFFGWLDVDKTNKAKKEKGATSLQALWRGYLGRRRVVAQRLKGQEPKQQAHCGGGGEARARPGGTFGAAMLQLLGGGKPRTARKGECSFEGDKARTSALFWQVGGSSIAQGVALVCGCSTSTRR